MARRKPYDEGESTQDDSGQDSHDEAHADARTEDRPVGSEGYEVVESGTIIDGIYYPKPEGPEHDRMTAWLVPSQAQALADAGVKLKDADGELLVATPPEPADAAEAEEEQA
jgi:hypothetical protein